MFLIHICDLLTSVLCITKLLFHLLKSEVFVEIDLNALILMAPTKWFVFVSVTVYFLSEGQLEEFDEEIHLDDTSSLCAYIYVHSQ